MGCFRLDIRWTPKRGFAFPFGFPKSTSEIQTPQNYVAVRRTSTAGQGRRKGDAGVGQGHGGVWRWAFRAGLADGGMLLGWIFKFFFFFFGGGRRTADFVSLTCNKLRCLGRGNSFIPAPCRKSSKSDFHAAFGGRPCSDVSVWDLKGGVLQLATLI